MLKTLLSTLLLAFATGSQAQTESPLWNTPGAGNPFIPGYFADPTIRKFGDTYYLYATTDGNGNGYGPAQVWVSKDFRHWKNVLMNWPLTEVVWAPDVMRADDGRYHYFYCEPCVLHEGVGETPVGPWQNILGHPDAVLVPDRFVPNAITLDGQTFVDDDGSVYLYFGTWGIYEGFGCGVARLGSDMKSFVEKKLIPNTEIKDFFEAPYVLKKDGVYYFMYSSGSCHDHTYRVQYATSTAGPMGPYEYQGCILETTADETVHGPGHHSVMKDGADYYIVYHRHNLPRSIHGFHRQGCIDRLVFTSEGKIQKVTPTHQGVIPRSVEQIPQPSNLAFGAKVTASSSYSDWFRPEYATDDNNATLWKPATCVGEDFIEIDLGKPTFFREVWTQFEYSTYYYQYKIETSTDRQHWHLYADKRQNRLPASPCIDRGVQTARYLRITITDRQKNGHFGGIWNVKVFDEAPSLPDVDSPVTALSTPLTQPDVTPEERETRKKTGDRIVDICADDYVLGSSLQTIDNRGGGAFRADHDVKVVLQQGRQAFHFTGRQLFKSDFPLPPTLSYSAPYTVSAWVLNPEVAKNECVALLMPERHDLSTIELCNGSDTQNGLVMHNGSFENSGSPFIVQQQGQWQHWVVTYDGYMERHYLNGTPVSEKNMMLLLRPQEYMQIGASFDGKNPFDGYLQALQVYDRTLSAEEVSALYRQGGESEVCVQLSAADAGMAWQNQGRWGGSVRTTVEPYQGKLVLTAPVSLHFETARPSAESISIAFALQEGVSKGSLLSMENWHLVATKKAMVCNGKKTKVRLHPLWNLLVANRDGTCWLNGLPVDLSLPAFPQAVRQLTAGGEGVALVSLQVAGTKVSHSQAKAAFARLTAVPRHLSATLQATPLHPRLVRVSLSSASPLSWRVDDRQPWTTEPSLLVPLRQAGRHVFQATVRDDQGNVGQTNQVEVLLDESLFSTFADDFSEPALHPSWKVLRGSNSSQARAVADHGQLLLQSAGGHFNARSNDNAILLYQEVEGDFLVQGRLTDLMGSARQQTPAYNEGGLMVLDDADPENQQILQAGIFPNYNCGNMLTTVSRHGLRPQYPVGNGWQYEPYIQIERQGNTFFVRTSSDGRQWHETDGSPVELPMSAVRPLKVGFFQVTYTDNLGRAAFDDFTLWQRLP